MVKTPTASLLTIPTVCTIVAYNYLAQARVLARSFLKQHPDGQIFVLLIDLPNSNFHPEQEPFITILVQDLNIPFFDQMAFRYTVLEFATAVKPFFLEYLFAHYACAQLVYLDPDIQLYQPLASVFAALQKAEIVLIPHINNPVYDGNMPDEVTFLQVGVYNLGFIGLRRGPQQDRLLKWWQQRMVKDCVVDLPRGLFVDQKWALLIPAFFERVLILRDPAVNVAYWNLAERSLEFSGGQWRVAGQPLVFFHFSGLDLQNIDSISIHQNRFTLTDLPHLRPLLQVYAENLQAEGHASLCQQPYAFARFENGVNIPDAARNLWRKEGAEGRWAHPFNTTSPDSFYCWLTQSAVQPSPGEPLLTNLALEYYRIRQDVHLVFMDPFGTHRRAYLDWFIHDGAEQHHLNEVFIEPIRASLIATVEPPGTSQVARTAIDEKTAIFASVKRLDAQSERRLIISAITTLIYYGVRNPLRWLGLHHLARRLLGDELTMRIFNALVRRTADTDHNAKLQAVHTGQLRPAEAETSPASSSAAQDS